LKQRGSSLMRVLVSCCPLAVTLLTSSHALAILPSAPNIADRINLGVLGGVLAPTSKELTKPLPTFGFTAEATVFGRCDFCPKELGVGLAYLVTAERLRVLDNAWLSAYWFLGGDKRGYIGPQVGWTSFNASRTYETTTSGSTTPTTAVAVLKADGMRAGIAGGYQITDFIFVELSAISRYYPVPEKVEGPLSSDPFWTFSAALQVGVTFGESYNDWNARMEKENK